MTRLQTEFRRLYLPRATAAAVTDPDQDGLIDGQGEVRALVLELARPADWELLSRVWKGVQTDLDLPAPAIAVSGTDGLQLWFSLSEPPGLAPALAFLDALRCRYLPEVAAPRVRLLPEVDAAGMPVRHARPVPALDERTGNWSAFVAPDLAPLFAETPWLDLPPGDDGQASLLGRLASIDPPAFAAALARLQPSAPPAPAVHPIPAPVDPDPAPTSRPPGAAPSEPERFLLAVMNDETVPLALRIEAARALLPRRADR
ncbi:hypothetical protein C7444_104164 [Sphaerotilus hippei]|uniref:Uncharacterized protein n=1 Tax=Sphaerotilus hippei TaxID=744406 RepID=A0A318HAQ0_9BURK|nr:hypothetical protein [Sphaerotilus hippei]PXW97562.1 hypothetical protein C7444_104164 [Sphaerotilus hippei]